MVEGKDAGTPELKVYRKPRPKSLVYGAPITASSYIFEYTSDVYQDRGKIFTALFGKSYPFWKLYEDCLSLYTGRAQELLLDRGNVFFYHTNYDDSAKLITYFAWCNTKHPTYFHIDVMWNIPKANLILFRDEVLTPIMKVIYNNEVPHLRRVAFRFSNHALHRKRFFHS